VHYVGHIQDVIAGKRPEERWILASSFAYAFEIGSPLGIETMGEMVAMNGRVYARSPQTQSLISGDGLVTSGALIIPHDAEPSQQIHRKGMGVTCEELYKEIEGPAAFAGVMILSYLRGTAITKCPIFEENIFEHREEYYAKLPVELKNVSVAIVGAVGEIPQVIYQNPFDKSLVHSHVLVLGGWVDRIQEVREQDAKDVLHLFSNSIIDRISLDVYPIAELTPF